MVVVEANAERSVDLEWNGDLSLDPSSADEAGPPGSDDAVRYQGSSDCRATRSSPPGLSEARADCPALPCGPGAISKQGDPLTNTAGLLGWEGPTRYLPPPEPRTVDDGGRRFDGVTYGVSIGYRPVLLDLWVPPSETPPPLVVWIHGGAWLFGDRRYLPETLRPNQLFEALLEARLAVATIDYRHSLEAPFPAQLHDAKAAIRYLRAYGDVLGIDASRLGVWGESAGGYLAAMVGLTSERQDLEGTVGLTGPSSAVDVVVDWYGPADLGAQPRTEWTPELAAVLPPELLIAPEDHLLRGVDGVTRAAANPVAHVTASAPPFLLVHGTADRVVPFRQSALLTQALTAANVSVRLEAVNDADHIFNGYSDIDAVVRLSVDYLVHMLLHR